jgi:hypothetical protein
MDRKVLAIILILLVGTTFLTIGCAGRRDSGGEAPTVVPSTAPASAPRVPATTPSPVPVSGHATVVAPTISPAQSSSGAPPGGLDPSLADITGEGSDPGSAADADNGLPTPTLV